MQQSESIHISSEHEALVLPTRLQHGLGLPSSGPVRELIECRVVHAFVAQLMYIPAHSQEQDDY
jgi:hypothetical protein